MADSKAKYTMNKRETWRYLAKYFQGKTEALKHGICYVVHNLWDREEIDTKTMGDMWELLSKLPRRFGDFCWPLTAKGHKQRVKFCVSKATEDTNNG